METPFALLIFPFPDLAFKSFFLSWTKIGVTNIKRRGKVKKADFTAATTKTLIADWKAILKAKICDRGNAFCTKIRIEMIVLLAIHQLLCCLKYKPATISQVQNV